ncbi:MAG: oligoribonuclease [Gammaproteobacteria bacterium]
MTPNAENLIWIDLEMTGLDTARDYIIEIATVVTDAQLRVLAEGPALVIRQPGEVLAAMDDWNRKQHGKTGLIEAVRRSSYGTAEAEELTLDFVRQYLPRAVSPMCGNSVCQDRRFLHRLMPALEGYFHYRNLDVSTLKELAKRWSPALPGFDKSSNHRALGDVHASIAELRYYREHLLRV